MKIKICILYITALVLFHWRVNGQCTPAYADSCQSANVLCSFSELNGFCCYSTDYHNPTACVSMCDGKPLNAANTGWWAFVSGTDSLKLKVEITNCSVMGSALQFGVVGDCSCSELIACYNNCSGPNKYEINFVVQPCKTYYLFVNGCNGNHCEFCLEVPFGKAPDLSPLEPIQGPRDLCPGTCNLRYFVEQAGACKANFQWTLDGNEILNQGDSVVQMDFPDVGDFILCVTSYLGNPQNGTICDQEGPQCITIRVRKEADKTAESITLCKEMTPYTWHNNMISASGIYRQKFEDSTNCCVFDSIKKFIVLDAPIPPVVYFLGCIGDGYVDPTTRKLFSTCQFEKEVILPNSTSPYQCDSSYLLNAIFINYVVQFRAYCVGGEVEIEARAIDRTLTCGNSGIEQNLQYEWFLKKDPAMRILGQETILRVPTVSEDYCLEIKSEVQFGGKTKVCEFVYCEAVDEAIFKPYKVCINGDKEPGDILKGKYCADTLLPSGVFIHDWRVIGGKILTPQNGVDTNCIEIQWEYPAAEHKVCFSYVSTCGESEQCCFPVKIVLDSKDTGIGKDLWELRPNPGSDLVWITHPEDAVIELELYNNSGQLSLKPNLLHSGILDISSLSEGLYFVKIISKKSSTVKSLMVVR